MDMGPTSADTLPAEATYRHRRGDQQKYSSGGNAIDRQPSPEFVTRRPGFTWEFGEPVGIRTTPLTTAKIIRAVPRCGVRPTAVAWPPTQGSASISRTSWPCSASPATVRLPDSLHYGCSDNWTAADFIAAHQDCVAGKSCILRPICTKSLRGAQVIEGKVLGRVTASSGSHPATGVAVRRSGVAPGHASWHEARGADPGPGATRWGPLRRGRQAHQILGTFKHRACGCVSGGENYPRAAAGSGEATDSGTRWMSALVTAR